MNELDKGFAILDRVLVNFQLTIPLMPWLGAKLNMGAWQISSASDIGYITIKEDQCFGARQPHLQEANLQFRRGPTKFLV